MSSPPDDAMPSMFFIWRVLFEPGDIVATPGAIVAMEFNRISPVRLLLRHLAGDWGDLCDEDKALNSRALRTGGRLLSSYTLADGQVVWIITYPGRQTCFLTPDEY